MDASDLRIPACSRPNLIISAALIGEHGISQEQYICRGRDNFVVGLIVELVGVLQEQILQTEEMPHKETGHACNAVGFLAYLDQFPQGEARQRQPREGSEHGPANLASRGVVLVDVVVQNLVGIF